MGDISLSKAVRTNLLSLQNTATMMNKTQERLATGNKVNSALDNPSNFFTATALNSRAADMGNLLDSMASGIKVIEAANNGLTALTKNLESMQSTLRQARQDKSFQNQSFEVGADSVIKLSGGALGNGVSEISLAEATKPGSKAQLTTIGTSQFLGVQSQADVKAGAGARSVINFEADSFKAGDKFTVAGAEVTVAHTDAAADPTDPITSEDLVSSIQTALADKNLDADYVVSLGEGTLAGKIIIESADTSAAAAEVKFDLDNDPETGVIEATKGSVSFNFSAVPSSITAGGQTIESGGNFDSFVASLRANADKGNYDVTVAEKESGKITLTSRTPGVDAPALNGITANTEGQTARAAEATFQIATSGGTPGTPAETTFELTNDGTNATAQTLTFTIGDDNFTFEVEGTESYTALDTALKAAFEDTGYNVAVDSDFNVIITGTDNSLAGVEVATDQAEILEQNASFTGAVAGLVGDEDLASYAGKKVTITDGTTTVEYTIDADDDLDALIAGLADADTGDAFTFSLDAEGKLSVVSNSTTNFTISTDDDSLSAALGIAVDAGNTTTNGQDAVAGGIGAVDVEPNVPDGVGDIADQTLTIADVEIVLTDDMDHAAVLAELEDSDLAALYNFAVDAEFNVTITAKTEGAGNAPTVSSSVPGYIVDLERTEGRNAVEASTSVEVKEAVKGAWTETVAAARNELTVGYGDKLASISINGVKGGVGAEANAIEVKNWQDATVASLNDQLKRQGITGLEAKFDDKNQLTFVAKAEEAKTLTISGDDAVDLFGKNAAVVGVAAGSTLTASKPVDKFVELINQKYAGSVRASNDNGKLRIENLSTQKLDVGVAANKDADTASKIIEGNSIRSNLSSQFNELRDQFDKLADDASFNGINLLRGDKLTITFNESGSSSIAIQSKDKNDQVRAITASTLGLDSLDAIDLDDDANIDAFISKVSAALSDLRSQASTFGSNLSSVQNRQDFTKNMINTLQTGAANLTLADMNEEAANLLALQTRQSLSSSALSMASQADQSILQLLR
jgi:flagellin